VDVGRSVQSCGRKSSRPGSGSADVCLDKEASLSSFIPGSSGPFSVGEALEGGKGGGPSSEVDEEREEGDPTLGYVEHIVSEGSLASC
jgi:hypothetical protein